MLALTEEVEAEEGLDLTTVDLDAFQSKPSSTTRSSKPTLLEVAFERLVITALNLIGQQKC